MTTVGDPRDHRTVHVVMFGASGRMGRAVALRLEQETGVEFIGHVRRDRDTHRALEGLDTDNQTIDLSTLLGAANVAIDFSLPDGVSTHARLCAEHSVPYVCGVTALADDAVTELKALAKRLPIIWAANMSAGVNVCFGAVADIASRLSPEFHVHITDIHHAGKLDAPSGTALEFGRMIRSASKTDVDIDYDSIREGKHPGEHHIRFSAGSDQIELRHRAGTRDEFAAGAVRAARWLTKQSPGFYNMQNVLGITRSA